MGIVRFALKYPHRLSEAQLYDYGIYRLRQMIAPIHGVTLPTPAGGKYRQIMVDIDQTKLLAKGLTPLQVVNAVNAQNLTLPGGTEKIGKIQYTVRTNSMPPTIEALNDIPVGYLHGATVFLRDIGHVRDGNLVQQNIVRADGKRSVLLSIIKNGDASTLTVVNAVKTTLAFEAANLYARASGYVLRRYVDIGDRVKAGQLLAEITAPEVEAQVAQYQSSVQQAKSTHDQNQAQQSLAQVTWGRDAPLVKDGWVTPQQGDSDRYTLQAQQHATEAAQYNAAALQAQLQYTNQQKIYQQVVAPFDGVITQRNIDVGSLITADATSGTAMFSMVHSDVIRVWLYVPQDDAFGVSPGVDAVIRVPSMPNLTFKGGVTRIANALQPGTRTLLTEVDVPNPDGALSPGLYSTAGQPSGWGQSAAYTRADCGRTVGLCSMPRHPWNKVD